MLQNYSNIVLDHYRNPRGSGKLKEATHTASELNPLCGDEISVYLQVKGDKIEKMKYEARGCALSIASASALAEGIRKQELGIREIQEMGQREIEELLGVKIGEGREQCVMLVLSTINKALTK